MGEGGAEGFNIFRDIGRKKSLLSTLLSVNIFYFFPPPRPPPSLSIKSCYMGCKLLFLYHIRITFYAVTDAPDSVHSEHLAVSTLLQSLSRGVM